MRCRTKLTPLPFDFVPLVTFLPLRFSLGPLASNLATAGSFRLSLSPSLSSGDSMLDFDQYLPLSTRPLIVLTPPPPFDFDDELRRRQHTFASFLSRDTTYDLIGNIWRMVHPVIPTSAGLPDHHHHHHQHSPHASDDEGEQRGGGGGGAAASVNGDDAGLASGVDKESASGGREGRGMRKRLKGFRRPRGGTGESSNAGGSKTVTDSLSKSARGGEAGGGRVAEGGGGGGSGNNSVRPGTPNNNNKGGDKRHVHAVTHDTCPTLKNLKEVCMDTTFPSAPEKIYNLMFTSGFMKDFWTENQKLLGELSSRFSLSRIGGPGFSETW